MMSIIAVKFRAKKFRRLTSSLSLAFALCLWSAPAHAYLDPGTGSLLLYAIVGFAATFLFFVRGLYYKSLAFLFGRGGKNAGSFGKAELVFYSEGKNYWNVFAPVIRALDSQGVKCAYLTSDDKDPGLEYASANVVTKFLGGSYRSIAYMNNLTAKLVVMTTPQLDVLMLRRSKSVDHYAHLIHAPTDVLLYKKYAFDYFDSVLCSGPHQIHNLRKLEEKRELPKKLLLETGCTYYDELVKNLTPSDVGKKPGVTVLIAPTWGKNGCLYRYGSKPIRPLLEANFNVILRPHPQMFKSEKDLLDGIAGEFRGVDNFEIDDQPSGKTAMARSDVLISDVSGIVFDYAFLFERPVLIIDSEIERGGFEAEDVASEIWELAIRARLGYVLDRDELADIARIVERVLEIHDVSQIDNVRRDYCYNFGRAGEVAAKQIFDILQEI
jgi:hypothetical protein